MFCETAGRGYYNRMPKQVLITGGAGFLGSNLAKKLVSAGCSVTVLDDLSTGSQANLAGLAAPSLTLIQGDVTAPPEFQVKFDEIYNLACPASPPQYQKNPIKTFLTSVLGMRAMLELALKHGARLLQASTSEIYGDPEISPQKEAYWGRVNPIGIRSCYDEGKRAAETLCMDYIRSKNADVRIVRIFNTYGPGMAADDGRVVSNFIIQALRNEPITIYGDGFQTRSFQYVEDLLEAFLKVMELKDFHGPVNLGNPQEFTMLELAKKVLELIPESTSKITFLPLPADDPKQRRPDISLAKEKLGWEPKIPLAEGLPKTIAYFRGLIS